MSVPTPSWARKPWSLATSGGDDSERYFPATTNVTDFAVLFCSGS